MNAPLFEIKNLSCAYHTQDKPVLVIDDLVIPKGKITVILGKSGSGKSTLVETLGLMNNTIRNGEITFYNHHEKIIITKEIWKDTRRLSEIRKKYYSFIFQEDYLIPYYSSFENVMIGPLIQDAPVSLKTLRSIINKMNAVKLPSKPLHRRMPNEMAGGQKQRLSFVRAMMKDFTVLFGDEPTGNLDVTNSEALMDVVRNTLSENGGDDKTHRSAMIVSHNIDLSVKKADMIIILTSLEGNNGLHTVEQQNILHTDDFKSWIDGKGKNYNGFDEVANHIKTII
jgi:ABC-type lipoprotein export system ATPase subunit